MSLQWVTEIPLLHSHLSTGERLSLYSYSINETILSDFYYLPAEQGEGVIIIVNQCCFACVFRTGEVKMRRLC